MKKKYYILGFIFLFAVLLCWKASSLIAHKYHKKEIRVTVFVHGSVYTFLSALDPQNVWAGTLEKDSLYIDMVKRVRRNTLVWEDQVMLQEGWILFPQESIDKFYDNALEGICCQQAAYQFVPSYHAFAQSYNKGQERIYFLFGHLGLLCYKYRAEAAITLYHHLVDTVEELKKKYRHVYVEIVTHSHGGNIALNLAHAEHLYKRDLHVDDLIMYGSPIQIETASYAYDSLFDRVINCYSEGDSIQANDRFSTTIHKSYKRFYDTALTIDRPVTHTKIYDVRLLVNNNAKKFGHSNMWQLGRESKATECLDPLPIAIITPLLLRSLDVQVYDGHFDFNIKEEANLLQTELSEYGSKNPVIVSDNVYDQACQLQQLTKNNWSPKDKSRMLIFNYQTGATLWKAFQDWRTGVDNETVS
jgi:hypothetical protein